MRWHLIGHLQRNKVERTLPMVHRIHAVDSVRLLEAIEKEAGRNGLAAVALLEVNASGEATKQGFAPADIPGLATALATLRHVRVDGLMTMAALQEPEACRPTFRMLRQLRDAMNLQHLSIGMSNDFEVAIEEGATFIRLGTVLFDGIRV
ncbi:MAG: hypothetical protein FJ303_25120 [Planctomycetes bacterium]|nr:hypothetical protein [Planctomycetota bacterium]